MKGLLDPNVEQHRAFGPGLKASDDYIASVKGAEQKYNAAKVRSLLDLFAPMLVEHLNAEIPTIKALDQYRTLTERNSIRSYRTMLW